MMCEGVKWGAALVYAQRYKKISQPVENKGALLDSIRMLRPCYGFKVGIELSYGFRRLYGIAQAMGL